MIYTVSVTSGDIKRRIRVAYDMTPNAWTTLKYLRTRIIVDNLKMLCKDKGP